MISSPSVIWRRGQEVAVKDLASQQKISDGEWDVVTNQYIRFMMDLEGASLITPDEDGWIAIALDWTQSCGNDVIEGKARFKAPVPEPATMLLLGSGLIGLAGLGLRS